MADEDLILSAHSLARAGFVDRVSAASAAGFTGIGLRVSDRIRAHATGLDDSDLRAILSDHGVAVVELEVLWDWALGGDEGARARRAEESLYELADALGGRHVILNSAAPDGTERAAESFAAVCDRAADHGLLAAIEFLPWTDVPDARTAGEIVRIADRPNGGVLVDAWHHFRGAADPGQILALPPGRIVALHIDDADLRPVGELLDDTMHHRRLPGEGSFDLVAFVRLIRDHGVTAPWGVEVISDELAALDPIEAAMRCARSTRAVLTQAALR